MLLGGRRALLVVLGVAGISEGVGLFSPPIGYSQRRAWLPNRSRIGRQQHVCGKRFRVEQEAGICRKCAETGERDMTAAFWTPCDLAVKSRCQRRHAVTMTNSLFLASVGPWICFAALVGLEANRFASC